MTAEFRPAKTGLTAFSLALAIFMQVLDTTIANVSLPTISGNLGASAQQGTWVITAFAVSNAISLPLTGWFSKRVGEVKLFVWATLLFTLSSLLCGLAHNMPTLIALRAVQGFTAGPMYPVTQALMIAIFPAHKRGAALSLITMVAVVAPIAGPILGGWITDNYNWPWIFYINVPVGLFASYVTWKQMRHKPESLQKPRMDYVGLVTLIIGVGALQILLDLGNDEDWFASQTIVALAIVSAIALAVFVIWELTDPEPIVNLRIFRHRNFAVGTLVYTFAYAAFFGGALLVPLWLQTQMNYTALWSGYSSAPLGLFPILLAPLVGRYANRFDLRALSTVALFVMAGCFYARRGFNSSVDFEHVALLQLIQGIGVGLFFMPLLTVLLSDLRTDEIAAGSGLATFMRTVAASFSVSLTTYFWSNRAVVHHAQLADKFSATHPDTQQAIATLGQGDPQLAMGLLDRLITQQSYQLAFNEIFYVMTFVLLVMGSFIWFARPPFFKPAQHAAPVDAGH